MSTYYAHTNKGSKSSKLAGKMWVVSEEVVPCKNSSPPRAPKPKVVDNPWCPFKILELLESGLPENVTHTITEK